MKTNLERKIISTIIKNLNYLLIIGCVIIAVCINIVGVSRAPSGDYSAHFVNWIETIRDYGFANEISDYPAGFNLILWCLIKCGLGNYEGMKWFCFCINLFSSFIISLIVYIMTKNKNIIAYVFCIALLFPSSTLNVSDWGQVDILYIFPILCSILFYELNNKKSSEKAKYWMFFMVGLALSIKQSAIFILPLIILLYLISEDICWKHLLMCPLTYIIFGLPQLVNGSSFFNTYLEPYINQNITTVTVANFTNIYSLFLYGPLWSSFRIDNVMSGIGNLLCIALLLAISIYSIKFIKKSKIILYEIVVVVIICCFKPGIHDRYMLIADILSFIYCFTSKDEKRYFIASVINFISLYNIMNYLYGCIEEISNVRLVIIEVISLGFISFSIWLIVHYIKIVKGDSERANTIV